MADRRPLVLAAWLGAAAVFLAPSLGAGGRIHAVQPAAHIDIQASYRPFAGAAHAATAQIRGSIR